jgi:hypothetical protein
VSLPLVLACCLLGAPAAAVAPAASAAPAADADAAPTADAAAGAKRDERTAPNVVFVEPLGNGLLYSINYARVFERWHLGLRAGASYFTWAVSKYGGSGNLTLVTLPLVASYYVPIAHSNHDIELGLGTTLLYSKASTDSTGTSYAGSRTGFDVAATAVLGYRYLPRDGGVTFGAGFTPLLRASKFLPWGGLNAGYVF